MEKMKKEECWGTDPVHPQKAFFKQLADLALSGLDKVAERCITGEGARGGKRPRGQEGWFGPRGGGRGGELGPGQPREPREVGVVEITPRSEVKRSEVN